MSKLQRIASQNSCPALTIARTFDRNLERSLLTGGSGLMKSPRGLQVGLYSLWKFDSSEEIVFSSITVHASYW
jgi:hypothetical protein